LLKQLLLQVDDFSKPRANLGRMTTLKRRLLQLGGFEEKFGLSRSIDRFIDTLAIVENEHNIPIQLWQQCRAIIFLSYVEAGLVVLSSNAGHGCVVAKMDSGWSNPASIGYATIGGGITLGWKKVQSILLVNDQNMLDHLLKGRQAKLGADFSVAVGPLHQEGFVKVKEIPSAYSYGVGSGVFFGAELQGLFLFSRDEENRIFYSDQAVTMRHVLEGRVQTSNQCQRLNAVLERLLSGTKDESATFQKERKRNKSMTVSEQASNAVAGKSQPSFLANAWETNAFLRTFVIFFAIFIMGDLVRRFLI